MNGVLALDPPAVAGHRRPAAVLFADLTGFTRLVQAVEPEIVYQVVRPLLDDLASIAGRFGGEIQQMLGDGFMCVFGLHATAGDEADRAVRAGLAMVASGGPSAWSRRAAGWPDGGPQRDRPSVHVGVEWGDVFVTPSWPPAGYGVWGRPVNLAQRLCAAAGPGEVQIGPRAYAQAGRPELAARPDRFRVKGFTGPVLSHRVTAPIPA